MSRTRGGSARFPTPQIARNTSNRLRLDVRLVALAFLLACAEALAEPAGADPTPAGWKGLVDGMDRWEIFWVLFGFAGQACFMMRFVYQWFVSERQGHVVIPTIFWYFSLMGGTMLFVYATHRRDPVFIVAQALGITIYVRNLMLIYHPKSREHVSSSSPERGGDGRPPGGGQTQPKVEIEKPLTTSS